MVDFGKKLKQLRLEKRLSQKQLASMIGVQNSVISFYEMGDRKPSPEVIKRIAVVLHVSADYLLGIESKSTIDVAGLDNEDIKIVRTLVDSLREKNKRLENGN